MDRNQAPPSASYRAGWSLSARRAWIEIPAGVISCNTRPVALRKESVDRNVMPFFAVFKSQIVALRKESVDRNSWAARARVAQYVALRKESVDRNNLSTEDSFQKLRRSPQGERG